MKLCARFISFWILLLALPAWAVDADKKPCSVLDEVTKKISALSGRLPISEALNEPLRDPHLRKGGWRYRIDDQKGMWVSGRSNYSRGVTEIYYRTPRRLSEHEQFLVMMDYLREEGLSALPANKVGIAIHFDSPPDPVQVFLVIDQARLKNPEAQKELPAALKALPQDFREFVLKGYEERLKMDPATRQRLRKISKEAQDRSILAVKVREPHALWRDEIDEVLFFQDAKKVETAWGAANYPLGRTLPDHYTIEGGALVVTSSSEKELLPLESLTGYRIPRMPGEKLEEIGRFYVDRSAPKDTSPRLLALASSASLSKQTVDRTVAEADTSRARLFKKLSLKPIHEQKNYEAKPEYILATTPEEFYQASVEGLLQELPPSPPMPRFAPTEEADFYTHAENHLIPGDKGSPVVAIGGSLASQLLTRLEDIAKSNHSKDLKRTEIRREIYKSKAFFGRLSARAADDFTQDVLKASEKGEEFVEPFREFLKSHQYYDLLERYFPTNPFHFMQLDFEEIRASTRPRQDKILMLEVLMKLDSRIIRNFGEDGIIRVAEKWLDTKEANVSAAQVATAVYREIRFGN